MRITIFALSFGILLASGCAGDDNSSETPKTLSRGLNGDPESLDPHRFSSIQAGDVLRDIGEGLVSISPTGEIVAGVAESWLVSSDGLTYKFSIRDDARWSTGENLSAQDFANSFQRALDPKTASTNASRLDVIENAKAILTGDLPPSDLGVHAIDERLLEIRLEKPSPTFLGLLIHPSAFPLHHTAMNEDRNAKVRPRQWVSNGAYILADRVPGSEIVLKKNQFYWGVENAFFDVVRYHIVDPAREVVRYLAGELDVTSNVDGDSFLPLSRTHSSELRVSPKLGIYYYGFNLTKEPFKSNAALRQALALAIDREVIVNTVTQRGEIPAYSFVPPGVDNYEPPMPSYALLSQEQRERRARELYRQAGYSIDDPVSFELRYNTGGGHEKIALAVSSMWRKVLGAKVTLTKEEFGVFIENVMSMQETQAFRLSWTADYNDSQSFLQLFEAGNPNNLTSYSNKEVDTFLQRGAHELKDKLRRKLLRDAEELAMSDFPVIPIYFFVSKHLVAPHICGWQANILDYHFSKALRKCGE